MNEQIVKLIDKNADGCGTDAIVLARIYGNDITVEIVDGIKEAINDYKNENEGEWDTNGCLEAVQEYLESEGYQVHFINPALEISF